MTWIYTIIIFITVLFLYIHINEQWRKSEQLEIYEMDYTTPTYLTEICRLKQPVLFELRDTIRPIHIADTNIDVDVKDSNDYMKPDPVDPFVLTYSAARTLFHNDKNSQYFMETRINNDLYDYGPLEKIMKPLSSLYSTHYLLAGSNHASTPLKYHTSDRKFITVINGRIRVIMTPWKSRKLLNPIHDYENYEFRTQYNPWKMTDSRLKFLEFDVNTGCVLFIPAYWWSSIKFLDPDTTVESGRYNSIQNVLANSKDFLLYYLQQTNISQKPVKTLNIQSCDYHDENTTVNEKHIEPPNNDHSNITPIDILKVGNHGV
jgi:hypothetical protein